MGACREFQGSRNEHGYGIRQGRAARRFGTKYVHRQVWIMANGPIPPGMVVRHSCDNPACFLLAHMQLGTQADNVADAVERGRNWTPPFATHCKNGHEFTEENTYMRPDRQHQECRTCRRSASARYHAKAGQ